MSTTKEKIEIMQAFCDGEIVESSPRKSTHWSVVLSPHWSWRENRYRVKHKQLECWVNVLDGEVMSTVFASETAATAVVANTLATPGRWTTHKFREAIE